MKNVNAKAENKWTAFSVYGQHKRNHIDDIYKCFCELGCGSFSDILKAYFTSKSIISYTSQGNFLETMIRSADLQKTLFLFKETVSSAYSEEQYPIWSGLCAALVESGLAMDHMEFFSIFTPYVVQDWEMFSRPFHQGDGFKVGNMLMTLCLILEFPPVDSTSVDEEKLQLQYSLHKRLFQKISITYDACNLVAKRV